MELKRQSESWMKGGGLLEFGRSVRMVYDCTETGAPKFIEAAPEPSQRTAPAVIPGVEFTPPYNAELAT